MNSRIGIDGERVYVDGQHIADLRVDTLDTFPHVPSSSLRIEVGDGGELLAYDVDNGQSVEERAVVL